MKFPACLLATSVLLYTACVKSPGPNGDNKVSIASIVPASGPAGTKVVIKGAHFGVNPSDNIVRFNNDSAAVLTSSVDSLVVTAPANGTTGPVTVSVTGSTATGPVFTYTADSVDVYAAGPAYGVAYWKNGQEFYLESTQNNIGGAYGIAVSDTDVYVAGYTTFSTYPGSSAAYWKNGVKTILTSPNSAGEARALVLSGNDLYVGGSESSNPVYWKNGVEYTLPKSNGGYARVNALAVNGSDVYAAGYEAGPNNDERSVYWKNGTEIVLGTRGVVDVGATSIATNGNDVYVCATDSGDAVYWKNGVRVVLQKFPGDAPVAVTAIAIANNSVYVTGSYEGDAVYWKDGTKITLPSQGYSDGATAITFYQSDMYIGGGNGYWINGVEIPFCCNPGGSVSSITVVKRP